MNIESHFIELNHTISAIRTCHFNPIAIIMAAPLSSSHIHGSFVVKANCVFIFSWIGEAADDGA